MILGKDKTRGKIYSTREALKAEIFDYIEVFYNRVRRHRYLNYLSPVQFEQQQFGHWEMSTLLGEVHNIDLVLAGKKKLEHKIEIEDIELNDD